MSGEQMSALQEDQESREKMEASRARKAQTSKEFQEARAQLLKSRRAVQVLTGQDTGKVRLVIVVVLCRYQRAFLQSLWNP